MRLVYKMQTVFDPPSRLSGHASQSSTKDEKLKLGKSTQPLLYFLTNFAMKLHLHFKIEIKFFEIHDFFSLTVQNKNIWFFLKKEK